MKMPPAREISAAEPSATRNRMRKTNAFLRKLSLKADKNCVQKRGANRLLFISEDDMTVFLEKIRLRGHSPSEK